MHCSRVIDVELKELLHPVPHFLRLIPSILSFVFVSTKHLYIAKARSVIVVHLKRFIPILSWELNSINLGEDGNFPALLNRQVTALCAYINRTHFWQPYLKPHVRFPTPAPNLIQERHKAMQSRKLQISSLHVVVSGPSKDSS